MKILLPATLFLILGTTSCVKRYDCDCTYISSGFGGVVQDTRTEETEIKGRLLEDARSECEELEGKYNMQNYTGTCVVD